MFEIRERFDFQAALERARKVLSNPNAVIYLSRIVHFDHTLAESEGRAPGDLNGVFDTLMHRTAFGA
jgi:hypothetical protein